MVCTLIYICYLGSYYKKWDYEESETDSEDEQENISTSTITLTKSAETLLLVDNEKARLVENYLKRFFFREFLEVSTYFSYRFS